MPLPQHKTCGRPYNLALEIDLADPELSYLKVAFSPKLLVITCVECDTPGAGPLIYRLVGPEPRVVIVEDWSTEEISEWPTVFPEHGISLSPLAESDYPSNKKEREAKRPFHFIGGEPIWIQYEDFFRCPGCRKPMRYVAQLDSETWKLPGFRDNFGHAFVDEGILYVQVCDPCGMVGTDAQYH